MNDLDDKHFISVNLNELSEVNHNLAFQQPAKAVGYQITQEYIVPKKQFYDQILEEIQKNFTGQKTLKLLDFGMGAGAFLEELLTSEIIKKFEKIHYYGVDLSVAMIQLAIDLIKRNQLFLPEHRDKLLVDIDLTSGANVVSPASDYYKFINETIIDHGGFDVILASQFEHYFPNTTDSGLAKNISTLDIDFYTKFEFRQLCYRYLKKGGIYFSIDDRLGETEEEQERLCCEWDKWVATQLTDRHNLEAMRSKNKAFTDKLEKHYNPDEINIEKVRRYREFRRSDCREEIEKLSQTIADFNKIFGDKNVFIKDHLFSSHKNFYLIWGIKNSG